MRAFDAVAFRKDLHAHPELGAETPRTAAKVAEALEAAGLAVTRGVGGHGVVASLGAGPAETALLLRADMDALPIQETTGLAHASTVPGRCHACGHDGHTAMLVAAGARLAADPPERRVHLMFQPDEESGQGAAAMIADGLLTRFPAAAAFALHGMPGLEHGHLATAPGAFCAFEENFEITLRGRGGHASMPERLADPLVAGAELVGALQSIVSRVSDPRDHAVVSVTNFETDGARNVVPSTVRVTGDCRGFEDRVAERIGAAMRRIAGGVAAAHGIAAEVALSRSFAPLSNDAGAVAAAMRAASVAGSPASDDAPRCGFSEDFAAVLAHVPGALLLLGQGDEGRHGRPLHDPGYEFDDALIAKGTAFWEALARR
ncbi:MAG: amidohydrolase [Pseudomonadota bacterium]